MYAYERAAQSSRDQEFALPSEDLRIAVTFKNQSHNLGLTKFLPPLSLASAKEFAPDPLSVDRAIYRLSQLGFRPTQRVDPSAMSMA